MRNKILAPLLDWRARLPLQYKAGVLARAQERYARGLLDVARQYVERSEASVSAAELAELRAWAVRRLEQLAYLFARRVRLDQDFERYLTVRPKGRLPEIVVPSPGPIDVNGISVGVEYSFRFADSPRGREAAEQALRASAEAFRARLEADRPEGVEPGTIEQLDPTGHGHNLGIRIRYTAPNGEVWRIEWDGIRRSYDDEGRASRARAGHIEVPSPKKAPRDMTEISALYRAMREVGNVPSRHAGGGHFNVDLQPLFDRPPRDGARRMANLIAFFESHREMIQFLWQHPFRLRSALPVERTEGLAAALNGFRGDWEDLARLLYEQRYFNPYVTRKPAYAQLNATAVMGPAVPKEYNRTIDIRNPEQGWFPAFGGKGRDRIELRLFDAPIDEYMAALQVKYVRALLAVALNARGVLALAPVYGADSVQRWREDPRRFLIDAAAHLRLLGLDPVEFRPLLVDSLRAQQAEPAPKPPPPRYENFLPARKKSRDTP